jgi:hypothetical protein
MAKFYKLNIIDIKKIASLEIFSLGLKVLSCDYIPSCLLNRSLKMCCIRG